MRQRPSEPNTCTGKEWGLPTAGSAEFLFGGRVSVRVVRSTVEAGMLPGSESSAQCHRSVHFKMVRGHILMQCIVY